METARLEEVAPKLAQRIGSRNAPVLAALVNERELAAGEVLIADRAPVSSLFLVVSGELRVDMGGATQTLEIGSLGTGKWVGEISLFDDDSTSTARVTAAAPSRVLELPHASFWAARAEHPDLVNVLTKELVDLMSERLRSTRALLSDGADEGIGASATSRADRGANRNWIRSVLQKLTGAEG